MCDKIGCPYCGKEVSRGGIKKHIHSQHKNEFEKKFKCKSCDSLHDASYGKGQFCSEFCSKNKNQVKITNISMKDISKENTFKDGKYCCSECDSSYSQYSKLTTHIFEKHVKKTGLCEKCNEKHDGSYGIGRFCSKKCANSNEHSEETKQKISNKINLYNGNKEKKCSIKEVNKINNIQKYKKYSIFLFSFNKENKYTFLFNKFIYKNKDTIIFVNCKNHGSFEIKYSLFKKGKGCEECFQENRLKEYIRESNIIHGNKYGYSKTKLQKRLDKKIIVDCPTHGFFSVHAHSHLYGIECKKCADKENIIPFDKLIENLSNIYNQNSYFFHKETYINGNEKMKITCKRCKTNFNKKPSYLKKNIPCSICYPPDYGFDKNRKAMLYYIRIDKNNKTLYKVGITNLSVNKRFSKYERQFMTIIKIEEFEFGLDAYNKEQSILKKYKRFQYKGENIIESGNTELFIYDVLNLDK